MAKSLKSEHQKFHFKKFSIQYFMLLAMSNAVTCEHVTEVHLLWGQEMKQKSKANVSIKLMSMPMNSKDILLKKFSKTTGTLQLNAHM